MQIDPRAFHPRAGALIFLRAVVHVMTLTASTTLPLPSLLALAAQDMVHAGLCLAGLSAVFGFITWYLITTSRVFDGLRRHLTTRVRTGSLRKIEDDCQINDLSMRNRLSCYRDGQSVVLCHEPLPFGIGRRCWRIPLAELKPRDDAVYDFAIDTPDGPLLCYFGTAFRKEYRTTGP